VLEQKGSASQDKKEMSSLGVEEHWGGRKKKKKMGRPKKA